MWLRGFLPLVLVAFVFPREGDGEDSGCGTPKQQTGLSGTFSSINYPNNYGHGARCTWIITVKPRWRIRIHFKSPFGFESHSSCGYDYVSLSEEVTSTTPIGKYCNAPPSSDVISQDNDMVVVFKSDGSNAYTGFSLQWTAVEPEYSGCGSRYKLSGKSGSISSMNYPNIYQNNADCSWVITVPAGMRVRLDFEKKFEIEPGPQHYCSFDNVVVRQEDATGVEGRSLGAFCGFSAPTNMLVSDDNNIAVSFKSDSTAAFAGFSIRWKAIYACGTPEVPQNGTVSLSDEDKVNSKATYSCNVGFKLVGKNRQCLTSGLWTGDPPTCQEILCPPPPVPAHGTLSLTDRNRVNSTATFTCNEGFKLSGGTDRRCLISGRWSGETPSCQEIHCGPPGLMATNGSMYQSDGDKMNSKAIYNCEDGYLLIGDGVRECLSIGTWSGETPTCREIRCGFPNEPANGGVFLSEEDRMRSNATYTCDDGFLLTGDGVRECHSNGNWSGETPMCWEIRCGSPGLTANGRVNVSDEDKIGSRASYTCNDGFKLIGTSERRCLGTGNWSGDMPVCDEIRCSSLPLLVDGNVSLTNENKKGSKALYTCNDGFRLSGTSERRCLATGNWSGDMPVCEVIRCGAPPLLVDGNVSISNEDKIGSKATYTCDDGFKLIRTPERRCLATGNWSGDLPVCEDIHCGAPPLLVDGNVSISNEDKIGSKATYTCDDGFKLIGTPERRCRGVGNWSGVTPTCEEIRCGTPSLPANGSYSLSDEDRLKSIATYTCDDGFLLTEEAVRECLSAGNWSGETPICQELRCGPPDTLANGSVSLSDEDRMDSKAAYTCDDGFLLDGEGVNECLRTGNWSGEVPTCQEIRCGSPSTPANGSVLLSDEDRFNSNAIYMCDDGFRLTGEIVRVCLKTGSWSEETPKCQLQEIRCSSPSTPTNGSVSLSDEDRLNSSATYTCNDGFLLEGEDVRECLQTGTWSGRTPICREIRCSSPGTPDNGRVFLSDEDRVNSIATYTCDDGFLVSGDVVRECLNSGNWSGETPICQEIRCGSPGEPANGSSTLSDEDRMHSIAVYACDDGYKIIGHPERQCLWSGNWSGDMPVCKVIRCGAPPLLADGSVSLSNQDKKGSKATYTCGDGFKLVGTSESVCLETGNWSGGMPVCEELRCGSLPLLVDGSMSLTNAESIGSKARFTCNDGFKLIGTPQRRCLATGNWSGDMPVCEEIRCGSLPLLVDGSFSLSNHLWAGSKATYSCNDGFKLIGTPERRCLRTGNWSGDRPLCQEIRCGPPDKLDNGRILLSDEDRLDSMARYVCNDGFTLSGESGRRCDQTGRWSGNAPECKEIRCGPLEHPAHGRVSLSDQDKSNSQATYVCNDGFRMVGKTQRLCLATWKWTGTAPSCQEIRCGSPEVPAGCTVSLTNDDRIGSRVTYSCKEWSSLRKTERQCLGTGEWSGTSPHTQGKEGPRDGISLPSKQKAGPASWSNSPYIDVYLCIGIVFNIVFLTLGICGTVYGVYRIKRRRGSQKDSQKLSSFNFDNPAFNGVEGQETQIAV